MKQALGGEYSDVLQQTLRVEVGTLNTGTTLAEHDASPLKYVRSRSRDIEMLSGVRGQRLLQSTL